MIVVDYFRHKNHFASCYSAVALLKASVSMAGTMEAALLVVVDNIGWEAVVHIHKKLQETSLQACAAVRRLPRDELVVRPRQHPRPIADGGVYSMVFCGGGDQEVPIK